MTDALNLQGRIVAFSMSPSNDLGRLGFPPTEFDRVVFNLCMRVIRAQGRILYGGHLEDNSLTARMFEFAASAYLPGSVRARADTPKPPKPFLHLLPSSEFKRASFARLYDIQNRFGSFLETRLIADEEKHFTLSRRDATLMFRDVAKEGERFFVDAPEELALFASGLPTLTEAQSLTAMRQAARQLTAARIVLGGKRGDLGVSGERDRFHGAMPGIYEETLFSIEEGTPFVVLGAYGGAARDVAFDLRLFQHEQEVPYLGVVQPQYAEARARMADAGTKILPQDLEVMASFAPRDDCEDLARDAVAWISRRIEGHP